MKGVKRKRRWWWVLATVALAVVVAGCGATGTAPGAPGPAPGVGGASGGQTQTIRFSEVIRSIFYAPHYVALANGFFQQQGLNVDMVTSQGSDKGAAALLAGTADISLIGPETSVYIYNQHGEKNIKAFYQLTGVDGSFLVGRPTSKPFHWQDLNGKSIISWRPGSSPQMVLNHVLAEKGVHGAKVITNIAPQAMVGAFRSGQGDYIQVYEPLASMLEQQGIGKVVASLGEAGGSYPETAYEATDAYIRAHPDVIQKWCTAVYQATRWMESHSPSEVADVIAPYFEGTPKDLIAKSIQRYEQQHTWPNNPVLTQEQFGILQNVLIEAGTIKADQKVPYNAVVETRFAQKSAGGQ
ncbi:MAG: ABC transporter substrate-binding protein [Kyrpidia tusciae]|nr:ABC transporter substrate-binding protein [Kyrpidia tusciae]MBE3552518.1 ABC transporter substrate-binding protein [Kyrpidia tusciae]